MERRIESKAFSIGGVLLLLPRCRGKSERALWIVQVSALGATECFLVCAAMGIRGRGPSLGVAGANATGRKRLFTALVDNEVDEDTDEDDSGKSAACDAKRLSKF
ncbi:hypothetical protein FRC10_002897, partial [Ceratobasidium sp. 414]